MVLKLGFPVSDLGFKFLGPGKGLDSCYHLVSGQREVCWEGVGRRVLTALHSQLRKSNEAA